MCNHTETIRECLMCKFDNAIKQCKECKTLLGSIREKANESINREASKARGTNGNFSQTSGRNSRGRERSAE